MIGKLLSLIALVRTTESDSLRSTEGGYMSYILTLKSVVIA
jgi:hypothetical protein